MATFETPALTREIGRRKPWWRELLPQCAVVLVAVLATVIGYGMGVPHSFVADEQIRENEQLRAFSGFNAVEYSEGYPFRWTNGAGQICLDQIGRLPGAIVSVTLLGKGASAVGRSEAQLLLNNQPLATLPIVPATRRYDVLIGPQLRMQDDHCFTIASETSGVATHSRPLGVPFANLKLAPQGNGPTIPAQNQLLLNSMVALVALWSLRALGTPRWAGVALVSMVAVGLTALIGSGLLAIGVAANRLLPPVLGAMTVAALGAAVVRHLGQQGSAAPAWYRSLLVRDLIGFAFWGAMLWGGTEALQLASGHTGSVWPLKARMNFAFTPLVVLPIALFAGWLALLLRQLGALDGLGGAAARRPALWGLALILVGAVLLPPVLKGMVRGWDSLYETFRDSPFDYQIDVPRVNDPLLLLRDWLTIAPTLSLHNSTHPPGSLLMLWGIVQIAGPGAVVTSWAAIVLGSLGVLAAFWLGWRLGGPAIGLLAGALAVAMPHHQVYAVTSMDVIFTALLALGAVSFLLALEPGAKGWLAAASGAIIALALFFTYAATQLFFFGVTVFAVATARNYRGGSARGLLRAAAYPFSQGLISAGVIVLLYGLLYLATGHNVVANVRQASATNAAVMFGVAPPEHHLAFLPLSLASYTDYLGPNIASFAWYLGPWGLTALSATLLATLGALGARRLGLADSLVLGVAAVVSGMWLSGIFLREVERIWAFAYILAAPLIAAHAWQGPTTRVRLWRAGLFVALCFAQATVIRLLLYTHW